MPTVTAAAPALSSSTTHRVVAVPGRVIRCEKIGPMHWRIHAPGRAPFDYWSYAITHDGRTYTESFEVTVAAGP